MQGWTLVFDLDGTLVDTAPDLAAATNHVLKSVSLEPVDQANIRPHVGHGALAMIKGAAESRGCSFAEPELYKLFDVFLDYYVAHIADHSRPFAATLSTLDTLKADGATLAVCTNKQEAPARQLLDALDMSHYFAALTGRDSLGVWKPDRGHILGTVGLAGGDPARTIMVGDSETDIAAAKNAGIPVVALTFGYSTAPVTDFAPDIAVDHWRDVGPAIYRLTGCAAGRI